MQKQTSITLENPKKVALRLRKRDMRECSARRVTTMNFKLASPKFLPKANYEIFIKQDQFGAR